MKRILITLLLTAGWALAYTPEPASPDRAAICNAVRLYIATRCTGSLQRDALNMCRFVVSAIDIESDGAAFIARGENASYLGRTIMAHLIENQEGWWVDGASIK
jgi:hypothetical protein